jgi:glycosyltransferase involved in cell wall biosynthesis
MLERRSRSGEGMSTTQSDGPIRVLHVLGSLGRGGLESRLLDLVAHTAPMGYEHHFFLTQGISGELSEAAIAAGAVVHRGAPGLRGWLSFVQVVRGYSFSSLQSYLYDASVKWLIVSRILGVGRRVAHYRSSGPRGRNGLAVVFRQPHRAIARIGIGILSTRIAEVASGIAPWPIRPWFDRKCVVSGSGFDVRRLVMLSSRRIERARGIRMLVLGNGTPAKNHELALRVLQSVAIRDRTVQLALVGAFSIDRQASLESLSAQLGVRDLIVQFGPTEDIDEWLTWASIAIMTSEWEGLPGAAIEARLSGLPLVATALPGTRQVAMDLGGVTLMDTEAPPDDWASAVLSQAGRQISATDPGLYDFANIVPRFRQLW